MSIVQRYMDGLKRAYYENDGKEIWDEFEKVFHGAEKRNMDELRRQYPELPKSLLELLGLVDGTYWREYAGKKFGIYLLGSDIEGYPYYLLSSIQMSEQKEKLDRMKKYINREFEDIEIDERITDQADKLCWLRFSNCMNNGGTSQLFIDFSPSSCGKTGQIVRYLHDPDEIEVISDNFDDYLEMLMDDEYDFINEDSIDSMMC